MLLLGAFDAPFDIKAVALRKVIGICESKLLSRSDVVMIAT